MAGFFDSVMSAPALGYEDGETRRGQLDNFINTLPAQFQGVTPEQAPLVQSAGYVPQEGNPGNYITPERQLLTLQNQRITALQGQLQQEAEKKLNNPLFRVGDTLADAGRLFLSPIFWLGGQDGTEYDPSERVRTGYRARFEQLEELRYNNAQKFLDARTTRLTNYQAMAKNMRDLSAPMSSEMQALRDFALLTDRMDDFNSGDPARLSQLRLDEQLDKGEAFRFNGLVLPKPLYDTARDFGNKFESATSGYREAVEGYERMMTSLDGQGGVRDIAAIFSFMKMLDPRSVVREGEFQVAASAGGLFDRLSVLMEKNKDGTYLSETVKKEMRELSTELLRSYEGTYQTLRDRYERNLGAIGFTGDEQPTGQSHLETILGPRSSVDYSRYVQPGPIPGPIVVPENEQDPDTVDLVNRYVGGR
jgi:hypothetical protein